MPAPEAEHVSLALRVTEHFSKWRQRFKRRALERACREFRATHARYADILFDLRFLRHKGAEALSSRDTEALAAYAWTRRFRYCDVRQRQRDVRLLKPLGESLLELVRHIEAEPIR